MMFEKYALNCVSGAINCSWRNKGRKVLKSIASFCSPCICVLGQRCYTTNKTKTGILMMNMGGPGTVEEVEGFLTNLFTDTDIMQLPMQSKVGPLIARKRAPGVAKKYSQIGGGSPILKWTNLQGTLMTKLLDRISPGTAPHKHYVGFRYAKPLMEDTLAEM
ncbi:Ferrochelatase, mitochondrial, partial [Stegodyphus mimosarum]